MKSEIESIVKLNAIKNAKLKSKLEKTKGEIVDEKIKWQSKIDKLNKELESANDRVFLNKRSKLKELHTQMEKAKKKENELVNYIESVQEENFEMAEEWKLAKKEKRDAIKKHDKMKDLAASRLDKWHAEVNARRDAENELARQTKIMKKSDEIMEKYRAEISRSKEDMAAKKEEWIANQPSRRKLKREWASEVARKKRGGRQKWPVWVVQLICELLINGTSPAAVPRNLRTMYETLYEEKPDDVPSINFVRQCRVVVENVSETIAAIKLGNAKDWSQLFTDATSRRQVSFTALIIGIMGDDNKLDPIVVSSCIFMEDETSAVGADGIIKKVKDYLYIILFS